MNTQELRKAANAIYLATDEDVAKDISEKLTWAADTIDELRAEPKEDEESDCVCPRYSDGTRIFPQRTCAGCLVTKPKEPDAWWDKNEGDQWAAPTALRIKRMEERARKAARVEPKEDKGEGK